MKNLFAIIASLIISGIGFCQNQYPVTKTVDSSDTYWGKTIKDPYRWLENGKDPEVNFWLKKQVEYTNQVLNKIPGQEIMVKELNELLSSTAVNYSSITKVGARYFYYKRTPTDFVSKIFYRDGKDGKEVLLFDPMEFSPEKPIEVSSSISHDGVTLLLKISEDGKEVSDFRMLDIATQKMYPEILPHSMFGSFVAGTNNKILYFQLKNYDTQDPENALNPKTILHKLGSPVATDKIILGSKEYPEILNSVGWCELKTSSVSSFMYIEKSTSSNYRKIYFAPLSSLENERIDWKLLCDFEDEVWKIFPDKEDVYFITSKNNPYLSIKKATFSEPNVKTAKEVFEGNADWKLAIYGEIIETYKSGDNIFINLSKNELHFKTLVYNLKSGTTTTLKVPLQGNFTAIPIPGSKEEVRIANYGWTLPNTEYLYNSTTGKFSDGPFHLKTIYPEMENLAFEELEIPSHDGTMVPLSLIYDEKLLKKDGSNITLMTGYGAYGTTYSPNFDPTLLPFLKRGGIYAIAHVRGGGEKGNNWHLDGKKTKKPNTWKDFNACAEYLIKNKFTSASKMSCTGGSAGGILIGRAITERPDLYQVAIPKVGVMNILRFVVGPNAQGHFDEFGTVTDETEFKALAEMDALQHIKKGTTYPAQLITSGYNDPRVPTFLVAKYAAAMQAANNPNKPTLLFVNFNAGHGGANSPEVYFKQLAAEYAFLMWQCEHPDFQTK